MSRPDAPRLEPGTRLVATRDQVSCELEGEAVVLSLDEGVYYGLNPVGAFLWSLLERPRTLEELRDSVASEYDVEPGTAEADVRDLMEELLARGLAELAPPA